MLFFYKPSREEKGTRQRDKDPKYDQLTIITLFVVVSRELALSLKRSKDKMINCLGSFNSSNWSPADRRRAACDGASSAPGETLPSAIGSTAPSSVALFWRGMLTKMTVC